MEMALGMTGSEASDTGFRGSDQGYQMKTNYGWNAFTNGTNSSGFSGLPGGVRQLNGTFFNAGDDGNFWSSSPNGPNAWYRKLSYLYPDDVYRFSEPPRNGYSVRCVRDAE